MIRETSDLDFFFEVLNTDPFMGIDWQEFLTPLAIAMWSADVDNPLLQSWVAHLAVFATGSTRRILIASAFECREELGDRQLRLVNLVLRSAAAWWEVNFRRDHREAEFDIRTWWSAELENFVNGKTPALIPRLESLYLREPPLLYAHWRLDHRDGNDDDIFFQYTPLNTRNVLAAVVHGTPLAAGAKSHDEAEERVAIVRLALEAELAQLVAFDEAGN